MYTERKWQCKAEYVEIDTALQVQLDDFLTFADYFFDGFFADAAVLSHIEDCQSKLRTTRAQVEQVLAQLQELLVKAEQAQEKLQLRRNQFAVER